MTVIKRKQNPKHLALGFAIALSTLTLPSVSHAGLQSEMDSLFGDMTNTTPPGVFETQRRGVLSGGRITSKSKIFDANLVSFAPPSWKGGCGGIDMFNGSFSFISADQIVQLLRSVAANAKGYAFQLALDNVCPNCSKHIDAFQKKIQSLNEHLGNSCQMAQGIVNDATSAFDLKGKTDASIAATVTGVASDVFSSREEVDTGGKTPEESLGNTELEKRELIGNIVWQQLKKQNVSSWFASGDEQLLEVMMSLTGTVIRQPPSPDPGASGSPSSASTTQLLDTKPAMPGVLNALLNGGTVDIYKCDTPDKCLNPTTQNITLSGLGQKVSDMLLGTASTPGIIEKYSTNTGILNTSEKSFVSQLPSGAGTIIRNLSILSRDASSMFALKSSNAIALNMVYLTSEELLRATTQATNQSKSPHKHAAIQLITESQSKIRLDYMELRSQHGDVNDLVAHYSDMLLMIRKQRYTLASLSSPQRTKE